jgi:hypothetical protein
VKIPPVLAVPLLLSFLIAACAPDPQPVARNAEGGNHSPSFSAAAYAKAIKPPGGFSGRRVPSYDFGENEPDSYAPQRSKARSGSIYSTDYSVDRTLGGNTRVSDRFGNSSTFDQTLGGSLRSTSNTGRVNTYSQPLGGGYKATSSGGTTYQAEQNLGGGYRMTGSNGTNYQRTQMLGGGYRYDPN